jgi:hypothetical protein
MRADFDFINCCTSREEGGQLRFAQRGDAGPDVSRFQGCTADPERRQERKEVRAKERKGLQQARQRGEEGTRERERVSGWNERESKRETDRLSE